MKKLRELTMESSTTAYRRVPLTLRYARVRQEMERGSVARGLAMFADVDEHEIDSEWAGKVTVKPGPEIKGPVAPGIKGPDRCVWPILPCLPARGIKP